MCVNPLFITSALCSNQEISLNSTAVTYSLSNVWIDRPEMSTWYRIALFFFIVINV